MVNKVLRYPYNFFSAIFLFLLLLVYLMPYQAIDPDSVAGFMALQGWKISGHFNCVLQPDPADISVLTTKFLTWWSPGQYLFPYLMQRLGHFSLGRSITILNLLAAFGGLIGFYKLFQFYQFPRRVITLSLLLILFSHTVLYRFILYQGGETWSFLFFPWLVYWYVSIKSKILQAAGAVVFLLAGFMAKSQMLIALVPLFLWVPLLASGRGLVSILRSIFYPALAVLIAALLIYVFFLSKGINPANTSHFNPSLVDTFMPLASPITAIANGWSVIFRLGETHPAFMIVLLMACSALVAFIFMKSDITDYYTRMVLAYYITCCCIFIFLYYFDAHIDYDVRHQKFIAYLFFPILVTWLVSAFSYRYVVVGAGLLCVMAFANQVRLTRIWHKDAYSTAGAFDLFRTEFPEEAYKELNAHRDQGIVLFFSEFSSRWAIDRSDIICVDSRKDTVYAGRKYPVWFLKRPHPGWEQEIKTVLPSYKIFSSRKVGEFLLVELR